MQCVVTSPRAVAASVVACTGFRCIVVDYISDVADFAQRQSSFSGFCSAVTLVAVSISFISCVQQQFSMSQLAQADRDCDSNSRDRD